MGTFVRLVDRVSYGTGYAGALVLLAISFLV